MKTLITSILLLVAISGFAQPKHPKTDSLTTYTVRLSTQDYQTLIQLSTGLKDGVMYNPNMSDKDKVNTHNQIEAYLSQLPGRIKLDSLKVKKP